MTRLCSIGDLILDVVVLPRAPLARDGDTPAVIRLCAGGQAANVAAWAVHLGGQARLICARGTGTAATVAESDLLARDVEIVGPRSEQAAGVVVSTREPDGARTMASDPGAAAGLRAGDLDPGWITSADVLHVSGYCLLRDTMAEAAIAAARLAHAPAVRDGALPDRALRDRAVDSPPTHAQATRRVTLDLASAHDIALVGVDRVIERIRALAPSLIFANEAERAVIGDLDGVAWVIKRGARGASFPEGERAVSDTAEPVDSTGAGDALAAGYLLGGPPLAMAAAARCVATVGAMPDPAN